jgi:hypothetical protein
MRRWWLYRIEDVMALSENFICDPNVDTCVHAAPRSIRSNPMKSMVRRLEIHAQGYQGSASV